MDTGDPLLPVRGAAATDGVMARREVTRLVNAQIRVIAEDQDVLSHGVAGMTQAFLCECGCMKMIELPLALYDSEGAWLDGHRE